MQAKLSLGLVAALVLAACGGGGGGGDSPPASTRTLSGAVVDGAIEGATVCLDLNNSLGCDSGEPRALTKADGSYALDVSTLTAAQIKNAHVFVSVPSTAKDADDGGKTLAEAGKAAFNLLAPAESAVSSTGQVSGSVLVSPLTTLVSHEMLLDGKSVETAKGLVKTQLGLASNADLNQNFVGKADAANQDLAKKAQFLAATLGEVGKTVNAEAASATTDKEKLLATLGHLKTNARALVDAAAADTGKTPLQAVQTALQQDALKPATTTLVGKAKTTSNSSPVIGGSTVGYDSVLQEGVYSGGCYYSSGSSSTASSASSSSSSSSASAAPACSKWSLGVVKAISSGQWRSTSYSMTFPDTEFAVTQRNSSSYHLVDGITGWVGGNAQYEGSYTADSTGMYTVAEKLTDTSHRSFKIRLVAKDISGAKFSEFAGVRGMQEVLRHLPSLGNTLMPTGAKLITGRSENDKDDYVLESGATVSHYECSTNPCTKKDFGSFAAFMSAYGSLRYGFSVTRSGSIPEGEPHYSGTFDSEGATESGGTMTVWKSENGMSPIKMEGEKASYTFRTVAGEKLLVIHPSSSVLAQREKLTGNKVGIETFFAIFGGKLYFGDYRSVQAQKLEESDGVLWNKIAAEAIAKAMGASKLPQ